MHFEEGNGRAVARFRVLYEDGEGLPAEYGDRYMKCFKKVINLSLANDWISKNPFASIWFHEVEVNKVFTLHWLGLVRGVFLFCLCTVVVLICNMFYIIKV